MISGISGFLFFAIEHIWKLETTENFYKLIFWGIETIYLIWDTFLSILCDQVWNVKVLLLVINENLPLNLQGSFFVIKAKIVLRYNRLLFGSFLVKVNH